MIIYSNNYCITLYYIYCMLDEYLSGLCEFNDSYEIGYFIKLLLMKEFMDGISF